MTELPSEIIEAILKHVDPVSIFNFGAVSATTANLIRMPTLWEHVNLNGLDYFSDEVTDVLTSVGCHVKSLIITKQRFQKYNPVRLSYILSTCINLKELDISNCRMINDLSFLEDTTKLTKLNAKSLVCVEGDSFKDDIPKAKNLTWLCLANNYCYGRTPIIEACKALPKVEYLDLSGKGLSPQEVRTILENCTRIKYFKFDCYYFNFDMDAWVQLVHKDFPCVTFTDEMYARILGHLNFRPFGM